MSRFTRRHVLFFGGFALDQMCCVYGKKTSRQGVPASLEAGGPGAGVGRVDG